MGVAILTVLVLAPPKEAAGNGQRNASPAEKDKSGSGGYRLPEAEFVGSPSFRSASLVQSLWNNLNSRATISVGTKTMSVTQLEAGLSTVSIGVTKRRWFIAEGLLVQGLLVTPLLNLWSRRLPMETTSALVRSA